MPGDGTKHPDQENPRFYGRRKGHQLRDGRRRLVDEELPRLRMPVGPLENLQSLFSNPVSDVWLEIGFGAGEHLIHQAEANPHIGFIGAEPFINGVARVLAEAEKKSLHNIRIHDDDARPLLERLPAASIGRGFLLFSDPWPKTRHHKRRFVNAANLDALARILKPGGEFRFASDDAGFVRWALAATLAHDGFDWTAKGPADWRERPPDAIATRYETKALTEGRNCVYLRFQRNGSTPGPTPKKA
ncbi:MAG: tRNA (guanosine(46)-N7)-methyltransferase TrmB [Rhodospirillaceae bacterium]|nr:tRNA (guanosine(46)-N7)-methyltransferase TrmB [Rhodospirillaceae bacterium]